MSNERQRGFLALPLYWVGAAVACSYLAADYVLNRLALGDGWQIFWPLNGVTVAMLLLRPRSEWTVLLGAVSIGTGIGEYIDGNSAISTVIQRTFSLIEVLISVRFLPRLVTLGAWLSSPALYSRFACAVIVGPVISGVMAAVYFHFTVQMPLSVGFNSWAWSDAMGIAATVPLVLSLSSAETRATYSLSEWLKCGGILILALTIMGVVFFTSRYPLIFVLYPLLMLVDWMLGLVGSSITLCGACVLAVFLTERGYGPFASVIGLGISQNVAVQLYLGFHLIGFLPVSILFVERRRIDRELREALAKAATLASLDGLTGIANRRSLDSHLNEQWNLALRTRMPLALLMIDADYFKQFNDQRGHQAGDECLCRLALTLKQHVTRRGDMVARFGGEEFAALLPATSLQSAQGIAEAIRRAVCDLRIARSETIGSHLQDQCDQSNSVTVSIGCAAIVPEIGSDARQLVELADRALYRAKQLGRNRVCAAEAAEMRRSGWALRRLKARIQALDGKDSRR